MYEILKAIEATYGKGAYLTAGASDHVGYITDSNGQRHEFNSLFQFEDMLNQPPADTKTADMLG